MAEPVTVVATIAKIRQVADLETADQANAVITDAELLSVVNDAYRSLYDIISNGAGHEYFATRATLAAPTFALPADFSRALGVDFPNYFGTGQAATARRFSFAERNRRNSAWAALGYDFPTYRVQNGALTWEPLAAAPTSSVYLWYIPTPAALASNGSFDAVNGYDDYVVAWGWRYCCSKQETDEQPALLKLAQAQQRVEHNAARIVQDPVCVSDVRGCSNYDFLNG